MFLRAPLLLLILRIGVCAGDQFRYKWGWPYKFNPAPKELNPRNKEHELVIVQRLHHLNILIFKDIFIKIRVSEKIQETYKGTLAYELGLITAGIIEHFKIMLDTYRYYTDLRKWKRKSNTTSTLYDAYHSIHGRYMQILLEKDKFDRVKAEHEQKNRDKRTELEKRMEQKMQSKYLAWQQKQQNKAAAVSGMLGSRMGRDRSLEAGRMGRYSPVAGRMGRNRRPVAGRMGKALRSSDASLRRRMRMKKWAERWDNFDAKREGIDIDVNVDLDEVRSMMKKEKEERKN